MISTALHLALREWRAEFARPATVPVLIGVGLLLMIMGPFETDALLRALPRFAYWLVLAGITYSLGIIVSALVRRATPRWSRWPRLAATALAIGAAVSAAVLALNLAIFGYWPGPEHLLVSIGNITAIAIVITCLMSLQPPRDTATNPPSLLDRIPMNKRGPLLAVSAEDHYVRVRTTKGEEMVLLRLSDAMREVGETDGLQVHRSHWVARAAVAQARRSGDRAVLTLCDGTEIPVSRRYVRAIKEAGFLPR